MEEFTRRWSEESLQGISIPLWRLFYLATSTFRSTGFKTLNANNQSHDLFDLGKTIRREG